MSGQRDTELNYQDQIVSENWKIKANCRDLPKSWFHEDFETDTEIQLRVGKACNSCPVRKECLEYGHLVHAEGSVWGGKYFPFKPEPRKK